ncbi:hypothetical protein [Limnoglobus roseus]|uniref:hypothetical protein n=1 Tax=Limnoglobus roseus TaxID=2598579 RepID=UPI0011EB86B2|nr:hypothetical protein [Limnoglobus roseus]
MTPSNDNRTVIYRIRRKEDGLFLSTAPSKLPGGNHHWDTTGCFWRKQETIIEHLITLCQFRVYCGEGKIYRSSRKTKARQHPFFTVYAWDVPHRVVSTNYEWMDKYEVVGTDISVHGDKIMEAREFASLLNDISPTQSIDKQS